MEYRIGIISRTYSHFQRYRHILFVLLRYGFDDLINILKVEQYLGRIRYLGFRKRGDVKNLSRAARIRLAIEELGPTFIKMGQALSTRSDLLPQDILDELAKLQDNVPAFPTEKAKKIIEDELEKSCENLFTAFEDHPLAAGSIGQVYRARTWDGREVAVKVQRPGIRRTIEVDLEIIRHMAGLMERHMDMARVHKPTKIVEEFHRTINQELDYEIEASSIERFGEMFSGKDEIYVHQVFRELSTDKVITTEFIEGMKPTSREKLTAAGFDPVKIAHDGAQMIMSQIFEFGFFHGDPHPGNVLVMKGNRVCFLDFGMVGRLDRQSREIFAELILNVTHRDETRAADSVLRLTHGHSLVDRQSLEREIAELIDQYVYKALKEVKVAKLLRQMFDITVKYELGVPAPFFLLIKSLSQIENLGVRLDPEFDLAELAEPHVRGVLLKRYGAKRVLRSFYESSTDLIYLLRDVPGELRELLKQTRQGHVKLEVDHHNLKPLRNTLGRSSNRISSAIVLASLIVGSSLIVLSGVPPKWHEIPVIGLAGYVVSGFMGIGLLRAIWKDPS